MPLSSDSRSKLFTCATKVYRTISYWLAVRPAWVVTLLRDKSFYKHETYYPEFNDRVKSPVQIFIEQLGQILKYGKAEKYYFQYGFDVKSKSEQREYVHMVPFLQRRGDLNISLYHDYTCILRDKMIFSFFADGIGIQNARILFYSTENHLFDYETKKAVGIRSLIEKGVDRLFCKPLDGEEGKGIFTLQVKDDRIFVDGEQVDSEDVLADLTSRRYIVQEFISQHPLMSQLHPQSINTIRLVTVRGLKDGQIHVLPSILRVGTGDSVIDNTSQGGLAIGINMDTGYLKQYGFYKPKFGLKTDEHPDSHIRFADFQIPFFDQVKIQAKYFHSMLPQVHSVGWDIAIAENGPIFIEGNDNWEITGPQSCNGGLKKEFKEYFFE